MHMIHQRSTGNVSENLTPFCGKLLNSIVVSEVARPSNNITNARQLFIIAHDGQYQLTILQNH